MAIEIIFRDVITVNCGWIKLIRLNKSILLIIVIVIVIVKVIVIVIVFVKVSATV